MSVIELSPQDRPSADQAATPDQQAPQAAPPAERRTPASDTLAERITARGDRPFRDEDDIVRGAGNFINDLAMLAARTDASVLAELADLKALIERRMSEAAMILTGDTDEARGLRGGLDRIPWSAVGYELGCTAQNAYEGLTPGVRERKAAQRKARKSGTAK